MHIKKLTHSYKIPNHIYKNFPSPNKFRLHFNSILTEQPSMNIYNLSYDDNDKNSIFLKNVSVYPLDNIQIIN